MTRGPDFHQDKNDSRMSTEYYYDDDDDDYYYHHHHHHHHHLSNEVFVCLHFCAEGIDLAVWQCSQVEVTMTTWQMQMIPR